MRRAGIQAYIKVGTTGTGGMGLNIPYTHGEEKPSRVLMSKSAMAGAHSLLLFLIARTPGGPIVKEVKPAAVIAWKNIAFGPIKHRGKLIPRYDCPPDSPVRLPDALGAAPEEIAATVIQEIKGGNTGADIVEALGGAVLGPTYRAGALRSAALTRLRELEKHTTSTAPRLSKLLYEAY
jgi:hypothetical protein